MTQICNPQYIGLIPAAGYATRLENLPCSKEIYPLFANGKNKQVKDYPVSKCLIDAYRKAGIKDIHMIIREGKEDICEKLGNGDAYGVKINYSYTHIPYGPAYTVDQAYTLYSDKYIALGFPDILFKPHNAYTRLIEKQQDTNADVVLGLFRVANPQKTDMVKFNEKGIIQSIDIKPKETNLLWAWALSVWNPAFSKFMHLCLDEMLSEFEIGTLKECHVGSVFQLALGAGFKFEYVLFENGEWLDIGTPEDLQQIQQVLAQDNWYELF